MREINITTPSFRQARDLGNLIEQLALLSNVKIETLKRADMWNFKIADKYDLYFYPSNSPAYLNKVKDFKRESKLPLKTYIWLFFHKIIFSWLTPLKKRLVFKFKNWYSNYQDKRFGIESYDRETSKNQKRP